MVEFSYFFERIEALEILEEGYGPAIPINELIISKKANKQLAKNPTLKRVFTTATTFNAQLLNIVTGYGAYSFAIGSLRGLGSRSEDFKYTLNWIGTHEEYNKEKSKK